MAAQNATEYGVYEDLREHDIKNINTLMEKKYRTTLERYKRKETMQNTKIRELKVLLEFMNDNSFYIEYDSRIYSSWNKYSYPEINHHPSTYPTFTLMCRIIHMFAEGYYPFVAGLLSDLYSTECKVLKVNLSDVINHPIVRMHYLFNFLIWFGITCARLDNLLEPIANRMMKLGFWYLSTWYVMHISDEKYDNTVLLHLMHGIVEKQIPYNHDKLYNVNPELICYIDERTDEMRKLMLQSLENEVYIDERQTEKINAFIAYGIIPQILNSSRFDEFCVIFEVANIYDNSLYILEELKIHIVFNYIIHIFNCKNDIFYIHMLATIFKFHLYNMKYLK